MNPQIFVGLLGNKLSSDLAEYSQPRTSEPSHGSDVEPDAPDPPFDPNEQLIAEFDRRIVDDDLRTATRSRFVAKHYSDAVESGVKALNECIRSKSGSTLDGDSLMTSVFSVNNPLLRLNRLRSDSDRSEQRGHMMLCQGAVAAWRNPRAHSSQVKDSPEKALMMLENIQHLMEKTKGATRTRAKKAP